MKTKLFLFILSLSLCYVNPSFAQQADSVVVEILEKSSQSWDGTYLPNYPSGQPEITIARITLPPKYKLPVHKHPIPLGGIVLEGSITVTREDGVKKVFNAGDAVIELVNTWHYGMNEGDTPTVLLAFYVGTKDKPITINQ
ncbi:MAG: cupin domain-containing protein [Balneola sp.]|nr:MAG: cupin domain-containing protein [Balneola sp.]